MRSAVTSSQMACRAAGSAQLRRPLSSASNSIPRRSSWRLAYSWPFRHSRAVNGKAGAELEEAGPEVLVHEVEVVVVHHRGREVQRGAAEARLRIGLAAGARHAGLLLALADVQHALAAVPLAQVLLGAVVLALALAEADQVDTLVAGEALDSLDEGARHGSHQRRGGHRLAAQAAEERGDAAGGLQLRLVDVAVDAVERLDLEGDVAVDGFGGVACYIHGAGCGRRAPHRTVMIRAPSPERPYGGHGRRAEQRAQPARSLDGTTNIRVALVGLRRSLASSWWAERGI